MEFFSDLIHYGYLLNALTACVLSGIACGIVGTYVVCRRMVFLAGGITHASFGGLGIAFWLGADPIGGALLFAVLSALGIEWAGSRGRIREDSAIGIIWSVGMAVGALFMSLRPGYTSGDLAAYLFGSIVTVTRGDVLALAWLTLLILLGALLFGPLDGLAVGFVGTLLYQLLRYGVSVTTPLWILPYALAGLVTGFYAKRRGFSLTTGQTVGIVVAAEVLVTALNTLVMYIDAKLYGYWFPGFISAMLLLRGAVCIVKAVVFGLVLPKLCARVRRALPGEGGKTHGA